MLDAGRIVEEGIHSELVQRQGIYASLWAVQTGETPPHVPVGPRAVGRGS